MPNLNIIITAHNECEFVKLCIKSIRMFADVENLFLILIDNNSSDGLSEWAMEQSDIVYIQNDDDTMPYGKIIQQVWDMLQLQGDLLLLDPHYMITPSCLSRMLNTLYEDIETIAVGPFNNFSYKNHIFDTISGFGDAVAWANQKTETESKRVMALSHEVILIKTSAFTQLTFLNEELYSPTYTILDFCLQMIEKKYLLKVCCSALAWNSLNTYVTTRSNGNDEQFLRDKWGMHYFNSAGNEKLISMIKHNPNDEIAILEIGCDCGATLLEIKNLFPNATVYGSEINANSAHIASHFATVTINNIEEYNLPYSENMFDYIIFGDVLEHLHNPHKTLEYCKSLLKDTGHIIASIPNLMHFSVMEDLLKGNFTYTETGLLDRTHIHLFTYNEILKMFDVCGYVMKEVLCITIKDANPQKELMEHLTSLYHTPAFMFETFQYVIYAGKK